MAPEGVWKQDHANVNKSLERIIPVLCAMKNAKNDQFARPLMQDLKHDDVRQTAHDPFARARYPARMSGIGERCEHVERKPDASGQGAGRGGISFGGKGVNGFELRASTRREAQLQRPSFRHKAAISSSLANWPSRASRRAASTSAA